MKNTILKISENRLMQAMPQMNLSFGPFIKYLEKFTTEESSYKASQYYSLLTYIRQHDIPSHDITIHEAQQYETLLEYLYSLLSPPLVPEKLLVWGISPPMSPSIFYGTDLIYDLFEKDWDNLSYSPIGGAEVKEQDEILHVMYALILQRLYDFQVPVKTAKCYAHTNSQTGLQHFYAVDLNVDFIEVTCQTELPKLDFGKLYNHLNSEDFFEILKKELPLDLFVLRGITVINVVDVTTQVAVAQIKEITQKPTDTLENESYDEVIQVLKMLLQNNTIEFDLLPFCRVNNQLVKSHTQTGSGILLQVWDSQLVHDSPLIDAYATTPTFLFSPDIWDNNEKTVDTFEPFRKANVGSIALLPLFYDTQPVGVICMHTWKGHTFDEKKLSALESVLMPIAQLFKSRIDKFNLALDTIIKERFTYIHPTVQWKFNEIAWHYLYHKKNHTTENISPIRFSEVFPLYGAIDIRNSTVERNLAEQADLQYQLERLYEVLTTVQSYTYSDTSRTMQELLFTCKKWIKLLAEEKLDNSEKGNLEFFLNTDSTDYLHHIAQQEPLIREDIVEYLQALQDKQGLFYQNRQQLEYSMQQINISLNEYLEAETKTNQKHYPFYFEKFRTDGIEYDIYIGQSIAQGKTFTRFHLKDIRLWQLSSMIAMAKITQQLVEKLPKPLYTTQLIFIHNHPVDICFREDEKRFDVEGAYNIRYQMAKKRIDKVHIGGTGERLTQPNTIALIYSHKKDLVDYLPFIKYLQETKQLEASLEDLALEEMQGLSGLRAIRVRVVY